MKPNLAGSPTATQHRRPRVIVYGYYGSRNLGDDLLLMVTLDRLRALMPGAQFLVRDHGHLAETDGLGDDVTAIDIERLMADQRRHKVRRVIGYLAAWRRLLSRADWLIVGGGTLFHARGSNSLLLLQRAIFGMARMRGVRQVALGVGISELSDRKSRWLLAGIIRQFDAFLVRDQSGLAQCTGTRAEIGGDLVFAWSPAKPLHAQADLRLDQEPAFALTVYPPACTDDAVIEQLRFTVDSLVTSGRRVVFLVFQRSGAAAGDTAVFERISAGMQPERRPAVRILTANASDLATDLADIGVVIGMRFHALVLAALMGKPFVGLAHDNKISDLCRRFDMPTLDPAAADLGRRFLAVLDTARLATPAPEQIDREARAAERNFSRLAEIVAAHGDRAGRPERT